MEVKLILFVFMLPQHKYFYFIQLRTLLHGSTNVKYLKHYSKIILIKDTKGAHRYYLKLSTTPFTFNQFYDNREQLETQIDLSN